MLFHRHVPVVLGPQREGEGLLGTWSAGTLQKPQGGVRGKRLPVAHWG